MNPFQNAMDGSMDIQDSFSNSEDPLSVDRNEKRASSYASNTVISGSGTVGLQEQERSNFALSRSSKYNVRNSLGDKLKLAGVGKASDGLIDGTAVASDANNFSSKHTRDSIAFEGSLSRRLFIQVLIGSIYFMKVRI
jgi:hypothetical protein